ncbi:N-acetylmuramoyl-L-alanine amidase [Nocardioides sp. YIM 152588]|uniref:N-acetylmuramoyl-L-alanine amidase family protein n=1 Tax=Nocardioides sp. YIM 152588 TaxID=3158259 RepID=UPI0032E51D5E
MFGRVEGVVLAAMLLVAAVVGGAMWWVSGPGAPTPEVAESALTDAPDGLAGLSVSADSASGDRARARTPSPERRAALEPAPSPTVSPSEPALPLAGRVVVLDPGHQLGNSRFPAEVNATVDAGGFTKACNTTGTATAGGYPEATFTWEVAVELRALLESAGAQVVMTRSSNSADRWGPCIDERGRIGNPGGPGPAADLELSLHGDGNLAAGAHGFHVIAPESRAGWTDDIAAPSLALAQSLRDGLVGVGVAVSTYLGVDGIDVRGDLGTLNLADKPTVMVELGNMRDPGDAALMTSASGRRTYAEGLLAGVTAWLG